MKGGVQKSYAARDIPLEESEGEGGEDEMEEIAQPKLPQIPKKGMHAPSSNNDPYDIEGSDSINLTEDEEENDRKGVSAPNRNKNK